LKKKQLIGRVIQDAIGKDGFMKSNKMTMGFDHYSEECGEMEPHHHAEETVYLLNAKDGWI